MKKSLLMALTAGAMATAAANATVAQLFDGNSSALIDSDVGMRDWTVNGIDNLFLQGFWFRTAGMSREFNIGTLALTGSALVDTNSFVDARPDTLSLQYTGQGVTIEPTWHLRGSQGNSFHSDIAETITIHNTGRTALEIAFFQYSDFDLGGTSTDQLVRFGGSGNNTAHQEDVGFALSETVVTPAPSRWQVDSFPVVVNFLEDGNLDNLNNNAGPIGPGDLTWAYQWDFVIPAGGSVVISKTKSVIPAPGSLALLVLGGIVAGTRRR